MASRSRLTLTLGDETLELLKRLGDKTGLTEAAIATRIIGGLLHDLWEYDDWLESQQKGSKAHALGVNLLVSYGPENLLDGIKRIDPTYRTPTERMQDEINANPMTLDELMQGDAKGAK